MIESCFTSILFWQIFTAQINQVFPAEDDVNKHVEDNCEFTAQTLLLFYQKSAVSSTRFLCFLPSHKVSLMGT